LLKVAKKKTAQADMKIDESGNYVEPTEDYGDNVLIVTPEVPAEATAPAVANVKKPKTKKR
jgi:hypothetical protein